MSSQLMSVSRVETEQGTRNRRDVVTTLAHPRGMGFRVLSRMARAEAGSGYIPRHRLDAPVDSVARPSFAH
jgi:hypothetical protein